MFPAMEVKIQLQIFFDMDFKHLEMKMFDPNSDLLPDKPKNFEKMKEVASVLSTGLHHLRVDFYEINNKLFVGELTFYHRSGFQKISPEKWNLELGDWINLR